MRGLKTFLFFILFTAIACSKDNASGPSIANLQIVSATIGANSILNTTTTNFPVDKSILITFSAPLNLSTVTNNVKLVSVKGEIGFDISFLDQNKSILIKPNQSLSYNTLFTITLSANITGSNKEVFKETQLNFTTQLGTLSINSLQIGNTLVGTDRIVEVPLSLNIQIVFNQSIDPATLNPLPITVSRGGLNNTLQAVLSDDNKKLTITSSQNLVHLSKYLFAINDKLKGINQETFNAVSYNFYTTIDPTPKFPIISDDELLTKVQQQTFKYFYDFAEPVSGMARERNTSGNLVTSGGSGFGLMALIVGMERGFITRSQGVERLTKVISFLETCDRYHGAWPHWLNGTTGKTIPFSANDNGADLVETSFLVQGLLSVRQYLNSADPAEQSLINRINTLWHGVEWDWFTREGQDVLYWHWSPDKGWAMNMPISGYNEALIVYTLAAASPTHAISPSVYTKGWARSGGIANNRLFYNIKLPLGFDYGGPLFFTHYSFLGMNPKNLSDTYGSYWEQNVNHTLINRAYCIDNPKKFVGYSSSNWGLTASDNQSGYSAHSPTNDLGVISPTAALSSMPYAPAESLAALKFFYYTLGDRLWGEYGFYDAFNSTEGWTANSFLAIDQGPIIIMIENHRTSLVWNLFMSAPEVKNGLTNLGFTY